MGLPSGKDHQCKVLSRDRNGFRWNWWLISGVCTYDQQVFSCFSFSWNVLARHTNTFDPSTFCKSNWFSTLQRGHSVHKHAKSTLNTLSMQILLSHVDVSNSHVEEVKMLPLPIRACILSLLYPSCAPKVWLIWVFFRCLECVAGPVTCQPVSCFAVFELLPCVLLRHVQFFWDWTCTSWWWQRSALDGNNRRAVTVERRMLRSLPYDCVATWVPPR